MIFAGSGEVHSPSDYLVKYIIRNIPWFFNHKIKSPPAPTRSDKGTTSGNPIQSTYTN
nr:MAG TPA: hypothetical protein [Caudoviricetes sp.]